MGKTPRPLKILVHASAWEPFRSMWEDLRVKGHVVECCSMNLGDSTREHTCPLSDEWDLILGPKCARFVPGMEKYLESMIKGARAVKFGRVDKDKST